MNAADEARVVTAIEELVSRNRDKAVVAFDSTYLVRVLKNAKVRHSGSAQHILNDINDVLSGTSVCKDLGGIFTVCEYEMRIWFLIRADLAATDDISLFDPAMKVQ